MEAKFVNFIINIKEIHNKIKEMSLILILRFYYFLLELMTFVLFIINLYITLYMEYT